MDVLKKFINAFTTLNNRPNPRRVKVVYAQLNSKRRKKLCEIQGIEYVPIGTLLADVEPILLPQILALIGSSYNQSELYTALISTAPALLSYKVDTCPNGGQLSGKKRDRS